MTVRAGSDGRAALDVLGWTGLWLVLMVIVLATRPLWPLIETRSLAVAWEMWLNGDVLVPHFKGEPYSHKPPLLFWLINLGWWVLGVNEWWPRLVSPLTALGTAFLAYRLGRRLWPDRCETAALVPWLLSGAWLWAVMGTMTMYDVLVAFCALVSVGGVVTAVRRPWHGWALFGLGIGLGVLAKGPVILVFTLPVAVLAPSWLAARPPGGWLRWYTGALVGLALGVGIALAWALPAAAAGGEAYADAILWGQTSGRIVASFAHERPFWWYAAALPLLLSPWVIWPSVWRGTGQGRGLGADPGLRLGLAWSIGGLVILSLISGKQPHYLIPLMPAFALVAARLIAGLRRRGRWSQAVPAVVVAVLGVVLAAGMWDVGRANLAPTWFAEIPWYAPLIIVVLGAAMMVPQARPEATARWLAAQSVALVAAIHLFVMPAAAPLYDVRDVATLMRDWQVAGVPLAFVKTYHGQFHFLGRLEQPIEEIATGEGAAWIAAHPTGQVIAEHKWGRLPDPGVTPVYLSPFRGKLLAIWSADAVQAAPEMFR